MSHYSIEELIARWKREELSVEQMIGQILQILRAQDQGLRELAKQISRAERARMDTDERQMLTPRHGVSWKVRNSGTNKKIVCLVSPINSSGPDITT